MMSDDMMEGMMGKQDAMMARVHATSIRHPQPEGPVKDCLRGDVAALRARLDAGLDVHALYEWQVPAAIVGPWRVPLLEAATSAGHAEITELLLARGADPDQYSAQDCHPLYGVAQFGDVRMAALLLDGGATVDRVTGSVLW